MRATSKLYFEESRRAYVNVTTRAEQPVDDQPPPHSSSCDVASQKREKRELFAPFVRVHILTSPISLLSPVSNGRHLHNHLHTLSMMRSGGLRKASACGSGQSVYVSGFRIVQDADKKSHCEYGVALDGTLRWVRFSQVKAVFNALPLPETSRAAWEAVRECKSPKGLRLETSYLARKCMAIENFLCSLLDEMELHPLHLGELLQRVPASRAQPRRTQRISRGRSGLRISMR